MQKTAPERRRRERRSVSSYYDNPSQKACFPTSVANLLLEWGDEDTADRIHRQFWTHELTQPKIASLLLLTRYVSDLTGGRYVATMTTNVPTRRIRAMLERFPPGKKQAAIEEIRAGRIRFEHELTLDPFSIAVVTRSTSHALTYLGGDRFIDDGRKRSLPREKLRLVAVIRIEHAPEQSLRLAM